METTSTTGLLALITSTLFAGAALYINIIEQPARMNLNHKPLLKNGKFLTQEPLFCKDFSLLLVSHWELLLFIIVEMFAF